MFSISTLTSGIRKGVLGLALATVAATGAMAASVSVVADVNASASVALNQTVYRNILGTNQEVLFSRNDAQQSGTLTFFNSEGANTTESNAILTDAVLASYDLLVITRNFNNALDYSASELSAIGNFANNGGNILLVTEAAVGNTVAFDSFNAVLSAIGSSISYNGGRFNSSAFTDTSLENTPISTNADGFTVNAHNFLDGGLAVGIDDNNNVFLAYEALNVNQIPVPAGLPLMLGVVAVFGIVRRRQKK